MRNKKIKKNEIMEVKNKAIKKNGIQMGKMKNGEVRKGKGLIYSTKMIPECNKM